MLLFIVLFGKIHMLWNRTSVYQLMDDVRSEIVPWCESRICAWECAIMILCWRSRLKKECNRYLLIFFSFFLFPSGRHHPTNCNPIFSRKWDSVVLRSDCFDNEWPEQTCKLWQACVDFLMRSKNISPITSCYIICDDLLASLWNLPNIEDVRIFGCAVAQLVKHSALTIIPGRRHYVALIKASVKCINILWHIMVGVMILRNFC